MAEKGILIETSLVLAALGEDPLGEEVRSYLQGVRERGGHISELLLAEIHNLNEPRREWTAQLFRELPLPILRINLKAVNLAQRYVYNKIFEGSLKDLGLHAALASVKAWEELVTLDERLTTAREGVERINQVADHPTPAFSLPLSIEWKGDEELDRVRALSWRVTGEKKGEEVVRIIQEMAANFLKEKRLSLEKVGKVELF